ncbi:hypothetical protein [Thiothrix winogradskyi]|uniref:Uncharacterized protein n=1 Tax=Thiothrix winogradskyi TaxID=96472 RepID=A0ABY3T6J2_9GAMM|nr:hypothetical protein [Thiothrix winogradskyi]UJS26231.1 hypothetical protein L2Y54_09390 [Thiothrix winogradskyi]
MNKSFNPNEDFYRNRTFVDACQTCANRESIYRAAEPHKKYPKNHQISLKDRVHPYDQEQNDWVIYDPHEDVCSRMILRAIDPLSA